MVVMFVCWCVYGEMVLVWLYGGFWVIYERVCVWEGFLSFINLSIILMDVWLVLRCCCVGNIWNMVYCFWWLLLCWLRRMEILECLDYGFLMRFVFVRFVLISLVDIVFFWLCWLMCFFCNWMMVKLLLCFMWCWSVMVCCFVKLSLKLWKVSVWLKVLVFFWCWRYWW